MYNVAYQYEYVFKSLLDLSNHKNGWYSPDSYIHLLDEESRKKIPWYYFYTPDYDNWHQHLSGALSERFDMRPTLIDAIPGLHDKHPKHHWMGCDYKVRFFIRCVEENLGKRIVFSDVCWGIQANKTRELEELVRRCKPGMTFTDNDGNGDLNIGMVVMDCSEECLAFWKQILTKVQDSNILDQKIINHEIPTPNLLDWKKIVAKCPVMSQETWESEYKNEFLMLKRCRVETADVRLGGTGEISPLPEIDGIKNDPTYKESIGIDESGELVFLRQENFEDRFKAERQFEKSARRLTKVVVNNREQCEMRMRKSRVEHGLPAERTPALTRNEGGQVIIVRPAERNLDDAFQFANDAKQK
ncbi:hypothetical protein EBR21_10835 [bacterium]|nr:hypothetical protein [bacterium]